MWGFVADGAAERLCRIYSSALGRVPDSCAVDSGLPALALTAIAALALVLVAIFARRIVRARR